ncbi:MAG: hypothetical protein K0S39_3582 [Paenibacillus sp.]|nr:hypothetical protein [Paenibacillus sp.]
MRERIEVTAVRLGKGKGADPLPFSVSFIIGRMSDYDNKQANFGWYLCGGLY